MRQITTLDDNASQSIYFVTEDSISLHFTLVYRPRQQAWFLDLESEDFNLYGIQICVSPNILDKYKNILTYGICIETEDGLDPWRVSDFKDGYCSFSILNKNEVKEVGDFLDGISG